MGVLRQAAVAVQRLSLGEAALANSESFSSVFGSAGGLPAGRRSRESLLGLYRANPWVRLAEDVVAARQSAAEWFLLLPKGARGVRSAVALRAAPVWKRAELVEKALHDHDMVEHLDHPFLAMMRAGVKDVPMGLDINGHEVDRLERIFLDTMGEAYYALIRSPQGIPVRWWVLPPTWVRRPQRGQPDFELSHGGGGRIPVEDMAYFRQPRPEDPFSNGTGTIESLDHPIQRNENSAMYTNALLRNRGNPALLISTPGMAPTEAERFEEKWRAANSGPLRAGGAFFIGYPQPVGGSGRVGVTVDQLSYSPSDMDLEVASKNDRDAILQVSRVPPDTVGITEKGSNRATSYQARIFLQENRTVPDLESRRNFLQERFFEPFHGGPPEYAGGWILGYRLPKITDTETELKLMASTPWAFTQNQLLTAAGQAPADGGDERYGVPDGIRITSDLDTAPDPLAEFP